MKIFYTLTIIPIILIATFLVVGCHINIKSRFDGDWNIDPVNSNSEIGDSVVSGGVDNALQQTEDEVVTNDGDKVSNLIATNLMLNWVINCESSGRHDDIWGQAGEYGILQFKDFTFDWLSEKYNFTGDWKNQDDQIELFLLTSEADKITHWSCFRKWLNYKNNNQLNE